MNKIITPVADRMIIKVEKEDAETASGIIIPDKARKRTNTAEVIETGHSVQDVAKGDKVLYDIGAGTEYFIDGVEHRIITEKNVIAVLEPS